MSSDKTDNAVAEYLHELELRLTGLPVLQRRELLAEIEAHICDERVNRGVASESDLLELLDRLGSPEIVAAAAYEEAGMLAPREPVLSYAGAARAPARPLPAVAPPPDSPPPAYAGPFPPAADFARSTYPPPVAGPPFAPPPPVHTADSGTGLRVVIAVAIAAVVMVLVGCLAGGFMLTSGSSVDAPAVSVEEPAEPAPAPPLPTID
jgi:hypothetical protein